MAQQSEKTHWELVNDLPFAPKIIEDLMAEVVISAVRPTPHATHVAEGRRELAIELLARMGVL